MLRPAAPTIEVKRAMQHPISDIAFTDTVKAVQERLGSRQIYRGMEQWGGMER